MFVVTSTPFQGVAPPALPQATLEYERAYQDQLNAVLRIYFNRLQGLMAQIDSEGNIIPPTTVYTVATLPSAVTSGVGARGFVSNALAPSFGVNVAGGGAVAVPVYSDGTNWKVG